ncbi:MAG: heme A synthase [Hyphomicrobiales bacterium]|nr:MAG: heme A synthase [Hyphomicrobiales bacterium]
MVARRLRVFFCTAAFPAVAPGAGRGYSLAANERRVNPLVSLTSAESVPNHSADRLKPVRVWLYVMALMVLAMVIVGGITRLTDSGLSIVEWKPISGIIPPLTDTEWQAEFEAYQQIPQYQVLNQGMTLAEFKYIFFWEWFHRALGRLLGFAFAVPFLVFLAQRRFSWDLAAPLAGLFVLGGFQGVLGWWMVTSGLSELTSVSQYRLAAHLSAALLLLLALIWVARRLSPAQPVPQDGDRAAAWLLLLLVIVQIVAGAFVAGLDAGLGYNTWPLMDGALVPEGLMEMTPWWKNLFESGLTVQFIHRTIAYVIVLYVAALWLWKRGAGGFAGANGWLPRVALLVLLQMVLGIATLVMIIPLPLALGHQALAFMLAGAIMAWLADITPRKA